MKAFFHFTIPLLALITMIACTELEVSENPQNSNNELLQKLSITGKDFTFDGETRSTVTIGESGASFTWDEDDVIGIFPDKGDQVSFAMDEGAGTQTATFSGGGWALKSSAKYAAYYPHVYENRDLTAIPVSYVGQTQNGNGNTDHIGAYDFMATGVSTPENGTVAFDMQHLGALVQLTITVPEPSTITKVVLTSSSEFTETGTIDLTADTPAITAVTQSNTFEITLNNFATTEANENVTVYFMLAPVDLSDSELTVTVHFADATLREVELTGKNLQAGKAYRHFADKLSGETDEPEESIPNNQIWYTATAKVDPYWNDVFGANIVSNTWDPTSGNGIITFDSDVTKIGKEAFLSCSELTSVIIPDKVATIDEGAFRNCSRLYNVHLGKNVVSIGDYAFCDSGYGGNLIIPDTIISIGNFAFCNCYITSLTIGNIVTSIGDYAFAGGVYTSVTIPNSVTSIGTHVWSSSLREFKGKFASEDGRCLTVDGTLTSFAPAGLTEYTIPNNVISIGSYAFSGCSELLSVTIPNSVTLVEYKAFWGCI